MTTSPPADVRVRVDADEQLVGIYALLDDNRQVRYVGQSVDPARRVRSHWGSRNYPDHVRRNPQLASWLRSLARRPEYHVFEWVPFSDRHAAEEYWTDLLQAACGHELLNILSGRRAGPETCQRKSEARLGQPGWNKGREASAETRAKMSAAHRGKPSPARGKTWSPESRQRQSEAQLAAWQRRKGLA